MPESCLIPVEVAAMDVAAVLAFDRVIMICVVIQLTDLVTAVEDRHTCLSEQECMKHDIELDSFLLLELVLLILGSFDAAQRSCRAAHTGIAESRIIIVELAAGIGSPISALQPRELDPQ